MRVLAGLFSFLFLVAVSGVIALFLLFQHYGHDLPDYTYLKDYQPPIMTRLYADDGRMMATIAAEQRIFVPIKAIPPLVVSAFLSAEDQNFYEHAGVDIFGIIRAAITNLQNVGRDRHPMGASTITQQVAKNMLLTNEVSIARKVREIILAQRLEQSLTKDRILEIYLNEIFLGQRSYGVASAALNYFNKSLDELTHAEAAYLAALPKAPNNYHPVRDHDAAVARRNWVLSRMEADGRLTREQAEAATAEPLQTRARDEAEVVQGGEYFTEEVRRQLISLFGDKPVLEGGLAVKASLDPHLQHVATKALRDGLVDYDRRNRGWRGAVAHLDSLKNWNAQLKAIPVPAGGEIWTMAVVIGLSAKEAELAVVDGTRGHLPWGEMSWARRELKDNTFGPAIKKPADVLDIGDVILVEEAKKDDKGKAYPAGSYTLRQVPVVQGAIVALDPHTGRVFAMTGGFSAKISQYNRATQAYRQPGSSFKPFVYMAALDKGFTPSSLVLDAPFEYVQGPNMPLWRPENYSQEFYGATPLRVGIEKSRNVMTVRLANAIGMDAVVEEAKKFGVVDDMPNLLSFSLGAKETTPLRLAAAYGMIVNGGKKITPTIIDRVQDRDGRTIWRADTRPCEGCQLEYWSAGIAAPDMPDTRVQIQDPRTAYQMTSMLEGVVQRGTGARLKALGFPLAGKTGTTNDSRDAWFVGFTPDLVAAVYVGFDEPQSLGSHETGASVAIPVFQNFMAEAMKDKMAVPFRIPSGLRMVRVDPATGNLTPSTNPSGIWEAFIPDTEPKEAETRPVLDGSVTGEFANGVNPPAATPDGTIPEGTAPSGTAPAATPAMPTNPSATEGTGGLY
ncbi:MAG: penicillin-binding protein 1A [Bdellovibrionales bacterium]|jgi:penicillin-binding protein 1A